MYIVLSEGKQHNDAEQLIISRWTITITMQLQEVNGPSNGMRLKLSNMEASVHPVMCGVLELLFGKCTHSVLNNLMDP